MVASFMVKRGRLAVGWRRVEEEKTREAEMTDRLGLSFAPVCLTTFLAGRASSHRLDFKLAVGAGILFFSLPEGGMNA